MMTIAVLKVLCVERGIALLVVSRGKRLKKAEIVDVIYGGTASDVLRDKSPKKGETQSKRQS